MSPEPARPEMCGRQPDWFAAELAAAQIPLLAYIRTLLAGSEGAWEVLQNANRVMCEKPSDVAARCDFRPWAFTVVRYEVLTFQINARDRFAIGFYDADGRCHEAATEDLPVEAGRWYHRAATSDGRVLRLDVDVLDGHGYVERAATDLPATGSTALGKGRDEAEWTIGRAGNAGDAADWLRFWGWIDEVRISDVARQQQEFLFAPRAKHP